MQECVEMAEFSQSFQNCVLQKDLKLSTIVHDLKTKGDFMLCTWYSLFCKPLLKGISTDLMWKVQDIFFKETVLRSKCT